MTLPVIKVMCLWSPVGCPSDTVSTTDVTWTGLGLKPSFCGVAIIINRIPSTASVSVVTALSLGAVRAVE